MFIIIYIMIVGIFRVRRIQGHHQTYQLLSGENIIVVHYHPDTTIIMVYKGNECTQTPHISITPSYHRNS